MREWLVEMRSKAGLSRKQIAGKIGHTESYYFRIEQGQRGNRGIDMDMVARLAEAFGVAPMTIIRKEMGWLNGRSKESI